MDCSTASVLVRVSSPTSSGPVRETSSRVVESVFVAVASVFIARGEVYEIPVPVLKSGEEKSGLVGEPLC